MHVIPTDGLTVDDDVDDTVHSEDMLNDAADCHFCHVRTRISFLILHLPLEPAE